ncbi:MAG TPA: substrate-binding domain-containing protein [Herbaspirillum sp.]|jgi:phosphate transport system substrate-binding protein|nr:substrate-binding domain-containing protein [Herbaspirillum sp.]
MHRKYKKTTLMLILACILLAACGRESASSDVQASSSASTDIEGTLHLTGSSTGEPLMVQIASRFRTLHPKVEIKIEMGGSARGIRDVRDGKTDIGMVSRVLTESEQDLKGFPIARDGIGLMVHKNNPVTTLTSAQVTGIFTGQIKNWREVGGRNAPIMVINREDGRGSIELFKEHFRLRYSDIQAQIVLGADNPAVIEAVAAQPNAISMMSVIEADNKEKAGGLIKLVSLDGVAATHASILSGNYPLSRPLSLVTRELPTGLLKNFIEYSLSAQVVDIIENMGFIPYQE